MQSKILILTSIICISFGLRAHNIESEYKSHVIYYNIISENPATLAVTYKGDFYLSAAYSGNIEIPSTVKYNSKCYKVTTIGKKAFYSCAELKSLILPSTITRIEKSFYNNELLERVSLNSKPEILGKEFFYNTPISFRTKDSLLIQNYPVKSTETYSRVMRYMLLLNVTGAQKNGKWGVIDRVGNSIIPFEYDDLGEIYEITDENNHQYSFAIRVKKETKWQLVDMNNNILQLIQTNIISDLEKEVESGLKLAKLNLIKGLYDKKIAQINSAKSECILYLNENILEKSAEIELFSSIQKKEIVQSNFDTCIVFKEKNRCLVSKNDKYGLLDKDGKTWILPCIYEMYPIQDCFLIFDNGKVGLIDQNGIVLRCSFDNIIYAGDYNSKPLFYLVYNNKWGLASRTDLLHDCVFDAIGEFHNGVAKTYIKEYTGTINKSGKEVASIVKNAFDKAYSLPNNPVKQKVAAYAEVIELDKVFKSGYTGDCYNNIGVLCEIAGDKKSALYCYEEALRITPGNQSYIKNRKNVKSQIKSENFLNVLNVISGVVNAVAEANGENHINNNNDTGGSFSGNRSSGKLQQVPCSYCKGTGLDPNPSYVASFGLERSKSKYRCNICNNDYSHYHKVCPTCRGKKYENRLTY